MISLLLLVALLALSSDVKAASDSFEAVSIRPSPPTRPGTFPRLNCRGGPGTKDPGLWICDNVNLRWLLQQAYGVGRSQLAMPASMSVGLFDITARLQPGVTKEQFHAMMQDLLEQRFHLVCHWETKEIPVYELTIGKSGPKFKQSPDDSGETGNVPGSRREVEAPTPKTGSNGYPELPPQFSGQTFRTGPNGAIRGRLQAPHATVGEFVDMVAIRLDRPVVDTTGLNGAYAFSIYWEEDELPSGTPPAQAAGPEALHGPSLKEAIEEQLGLKLLSKKAAVSMLNIDHLDSSPTEN